MISIIGLLLGILLPALGAVRRSANRAACGANLHGIAHAVRAYLDVSGDVMPVAAAMPSLNLNSHPGIAEALEPHVDSPRAFLCPSDPGEKYFKSEKSSYAYHITLGGRKVEQDFLTKRLGASNSPVMYDYEPSHGAPATGGSTNYLFVDGHVGDLAGGIESLPPPPPSP